MTGLSRAEAGPMVPIFQCIANLCRTEPDVQPRISAVWPMHFPRLYASHNRRSSASVHLLLWRRGTVGLVVITIVHDVGGRNSTSASISASDPETSEGSQDRGRLATLPSWPHTDTPGPGTRDGSGDRGRLVLSSFAGSKFDSISASPCMDLGSVDVAQLLPPCGGGDDDGNDMGLNSELVSPVVSARVSGPWTSEAMGDRCRLLSLSSRLATLDTAK